MSAPLKQILAEVTSEILETMFFVLPEPAAPEISEPKELVFDVWGRISLGTPQGVQLNLFLPKPLALEMTGNFIGVGQEDIADEALLDMTRELVNMIAGNFVNKVGKQAGLELGIPDASFSRRALPFSGREENKHVFIEIDDKVMMLSLTTKES